MSIANQVTKHKLPFSYQDVSDGLVDIIPKSGMTIKSDSQNIYDGLIGGTTKGLCRITVSAGILSFWREDLTIVVEKIDDNSTNIGIDAALIVRSSLAQHQKTFNNIIIALSRSFQVKAMNIAYKNRIPDELVQALANVMKFDIDMTTSVVGASSGEQHKAWRKDAKIAAEIVRIRAKNDADIAQALANLGKSDVAAMTVMVNEATKEQRRAWIDNDTITAEIARIRFESERILNEEHDQAFGNLKKINETSADNLAKKHKREMAEEQRRMYASIENELARIRAEKAAKRAAEQS
jgi:hypothetical protein